MTKLLFFIGLLASTLPAQTAQDLVLNSSGGLSIPPEDQIRIGLEMGVENEDLQTFFDFENISQSKFTITGLSVKNKAFVIKATNVKN